MNDLISVVIPAYNVAPYIRKCLDSVLNQTYHNVEIIVIDDGSIDDTPKICDEYSEYYSSISVIHKKNEGQAVARNIGISRAKGKWLHLLDSDDWIEPQMYEKLIAVANTTGCKIVSCGFRRVFLNIVENNHVDDESVLVIQQEDVIKDFLYNRYFNYELWNKLFLRELFDDITFIPGQLSEEVHIARLLYFKVQSIAHTNSVYYNYLVLRSGNTASSFKTSRMCIFNEFDEMTATLSRTGKGHLMKYINATAAKYSYQIFFSAVISNVDKDIQKLLITLYRKYYNKIKDTNLVNIKYKLFYYSPQIFVRLLYIKLKLLKMTNHKVL